MDDVVDSDVEAVADGVTCLFCGEPEHVAVHEVWGHDYMLDTCCAALFDQLCSDMTADPEWAKAFMQSLAIEELCGHRLRRVADDGGSALILDWQLDLAASVTFQQAKTFIQRHHHHCRAPVTWRFHQGIFNGGTLIGVFYGVVLSSSSTLS